jgi:hypothetical protein
VKWRQPAGRRLGVVKFELNLALPIRAPLCPPAVTTAMEERILSGSDAHQLLPLDTNPATTHRFGCPYAGALRMCALRGLACRSAEISPASAPAASSLPEEVQRRFIWYLYTLPHSLPLEFIFV